MLHNLANRFYDFPEFCQFWLNSKTLHSGMFMVFLTEDLKERIK